MNTEEEKVALPDQATLRELAVRAECDPRTIIRALRGEPVRGMAGHRIHKVLTEAGLVKDPRPRVGATFGEAVEALKRGRRIARAKWNGKNMWLVLIEEGGWRSESAPKTRHYLEGWIAIKTEDDRFIPWAPEHADLLAEDWQIEGSS